MNLVDGLLMIKDLYDNGFTYEIEEYIEKYNKWVVESDFPEAQIQILVDDFGEKYIPDSEKVLIARNIADILLNTPQ